MKNQTLIVGLVMVYSNTAVACRLSLVDKPEHADCVFWEGDAGCAIYPVRPTQCRTFPFWSEHLRSPEAWRERAGGSPVKMQPRRPRA